MNKNIIEQHSEAIKKELAGIEVKREALKSEESLVKYLMNLVPELAKLPTIITRGSKVDFISFEVESLEQAAYILNGLYATNQTSEYTTTMSNSPKIIESPYQIDIENSAYGTSCLSIKWTHGEFNVWLKVPKGLLPGTDFFSREFRKVYDCEYHYFVGTSMKELLQMKVPCLTFRRGEVTGFYGGDRRQDSGWAANEIADYIKQYKTE